MLLGFICIWLHALYSSEFIWFRGHYISYHDYVMVPLHICHAVSSLCFRELSHLSWTYAISIVVASSHTGHYMFVFGVYSHNIDRWASFIGSIFFIYVFMLYFPHRWDVFVWFTTHKDSCNMLSIALNMNNALKPKACLSLGKSLKCAALFEWGTTNTG